MKPLRLNRRITEDCGVYGGVEYCEASCNCALKTMPTALQSPLLASKTISQGHDSDLFAEAGGVP